MWMDTSSSGILVWGIVVLGRESLVFVITIARAFPLAAPPCKFRRFSLAPSSIGTPPVGHVHVAIEPLLSTAASATHAADAPRIRRRRNSLALAPGRGCESVPQPLSVWLTTAVVVGGGSSAKRTDEDVLEHKRRRSRFGKRKGRRRRREVRDRRGNDTGDGCRFECDSSGREERCSEAKVEEMDARDMMGVDLRTSGRFELHRGLGPRGKPKTWSWSKSWAPWDSCKWTRLRRSKTQSSTTTNAKL